MRRFYDGETNEIVSIVQLRTEYDELKAEGNTEAEDFPAYVSNCMTYNNGTLEEVTSLFEKVNINGYKFRLVLKNGVPSYAEKEEDLCSLIEYFKTKELI